MDDLQWEIREEHRRLQRIDPELEGWVAAANRSNFSLSLTISTGGLIVTGLLVSAKRYFELLAERTRSIAVADSEAVQHFADLLQSRAASMATPALQEGEESEESDEQYLERLRAGPFYVHLADAQFLIGNKFGPEEGLPWRCKLSAVDGWTIAQLGTP